MFITGTIVCTLTVLAYADIDTLTVQGIVQFLVGFGVVFAVASSFIPEEVCHICLIRSGILC